VDDHYKILGIQRSATTEEVKKAYFDLAKKYHPDSGDASAVKKFYQISTAYKILSDLSAKKSYDSHLESSKKVKLTENISESSFYSSKRESYRDEELKSYHKNRFKKAFFRVIISTFLFAFLFYLISIITGGIGVLSFLSGLFIGLHFSIYKNFDLDSYFSSKNKQILFIYCLRFFSSFGIIYFVWVLFHFFTS